MTWGSAMVVIALGTNLVSEKVIDTSQLFSFIFNSTGVILSLTDVLTQTSRFSEFVGTAASVFNMIHRKPRPPEGFFLIDRESMNLSKSEESGSEGVPRFFKSTSVTRDMFSEGVVFQDVHLTYRKDLKDVQALRGISLQLKPNTKVALVGSSGAGKSSVLNLLSRFYDPTQGSITVGGYDLRDLDLVEYRSMISIVDQDADVFATSLLENIVYGLSDEPGFDKAIEVALRRLNGDSDEEKGQISLFRRLTDR